MNATDDDFQTENIATEAGGVEAENCKFLFVNSAPMGKRKRILTGPQPGVSVSIICCIVSPISRIFLHVSRQIGEREWPQHGKSIQIEQMYQQLNEISPFPSLNIHSSSFNFQGIAKNREITYIASDPRSVFHP